MAGTLNRAQRAAARGQGALARWLAGLPEPIVRALAGPLRTGDGQTLDPEAQLLLRLRALVRAPELDTLTPEQARRRLAGDAMSVQGRRPEPVRTEPVSVRGGPALVPARLYTPIHLPAPSPLLVYFHGGGFVSGDLDTHDHLCRLLALGGGVRLLAVDYRRAPEHRFPAAAHDAWAAFAFAAAQAEELGADPGRLAVGGDSAGGNLAAGVAQRAARSEGPAPRLQLLFYPWLDLSSKRNSYRQFGEGLYLTERDLDWYRSHYVGAGGEAADPRCSPLLVTALDGVAPAYIATSGFDPLRDEGEEYGVRLRAAGVPASVYRHRGLLHGFANVLGLGQAGREAVWHAAGALAQTLAR